ncbi:MAG TPA: hypothetical protein VL995_11155 [Cellvibrio sp.]|nr:hypothetical protein [Cellvibrio sp.]
MEILAVWLIHHKASMTLDSPMNMDGSEYIVGIGVVPATNMQEALQLFDAYLKKQDMAVLEAWKCEQYFPKNFSEISQKNSDINEVAQEALESNKISYVCGISSEALDCEEEQ